MGFEPLKKSLYLLNTRFMCQEPVDYKTGSDVNSLDIFLKYGAPKALTSEFPGIVQIIPPANINIISSLQRLVLKACKSI